MMTISSIDHCAPTGELSPVQQAVFAALTALEIPFSRVEHPHADTMADCAAIGEALGVDVCKNLVLCNRQKTQFYLLTMPSDKPFHTKDLSHQIGSARLSFASAEDMQMLLQVSPGSASILALLFDKENRGQLVMDRETREGTYFGCHPCLNTGTLKVLTADLLEKFLPHTGHVPLVVDLPRYPGE